VDGPVLVPVGRANEGCTIVDGTTLEVVASEPVGLPAPASPSTAMKEGAGASVGGNGVPGKQNNASVTPDQIRPDACGLSTSHLGSNEDQAHDCWFHTLVANSSDLIAVLDDQARVLYANPAAERMLGLHPDTHVVRSALKLIHPDDRDAIREVFRERTLQAGIGHSAVLRLKAASGDWRSFEAVATNCLDDPVVRGIVVSARDVTEQMNLARVLRTVSHGNQAVVHAVDEASLQRDICETIVAAGYLLAWVGYAEHDTAYTVRPLGSAGRTVYLGRVCVSWGDDPRGGSPPGRAIRTRSVQVLKDIHRSARFAPWGAVAEEYGFRAACALPLIVGDDTVGALAIYAGDPEAFDAASVAVLGELAADLAYGIGRLRDGERLARSEALLHEAQAISHVGHWQWDIMNARIAGMGEMSVIAGIAPGQWPGTREALENVVHPEDRAAVQQALDRMLLGDAIDLEHRIVRPNGDIRYVRQRAPASRGENRTYILGVCQDVTEERIAAMALERANEELRQKSLEARSSLEKLRIIDEQRRRLLGAIVSAQESERRRVAADVHDDSIQALAATMMRLSVIRREIADPALNERLGEFSSSLGHSIESLRHLVFELRPPSLDREGLEAAFRESLSGWAAEANVGFIVTSDLATPPSSEERAVLFRIGQEALSNVRKHAQAQSVSVSVTDVGEGILLSVADDGVGFADGGPAVTKGIGHFGVANMTERAELAGGWLRIDHPPRGTLVEAWIPVSRVPNAQTAAGILT
jgi:PAS domain S-box-containing protein